MFGERVVLCAAAAAAEEGGGCVTVRARELYVVGRCQIWTCVLQHQGQKRLLTQSERIDAEEDWSMWFVGIGGDSKLAEPGRGRAWPGTCSFGAVRCGCTQTVQAVGDRWETRTARLQQWA